MDLDIDAVVTWVDGACSKHREKRLLFEGEAKKLGMVATGASATRFANSGELWYCLHLARKNAPWLRTIFLVTDNQRPSWLDRTLESKLGVKVVDHQVIFDGYEKYLPTFNSRSIEAMLSRIPGLSERFIYLNDDFFIIRSVCPEDYFLDGRPILRGKWAWRNRYLAWVERLVRRWRGESLGLVGVRPEHWALGLRRYFSAAHTPHPITRNEFEKRIHGYSEIGNVIRYKFRNNNQIWPIGLYQNQCLLEGLALTKDHDWAYVSPEHQTNDVVKILNIARSDASLLHLCVQSLDLFNEESQSAFQRFLDLQNIPRPYRLFDESGGCHVG